MSVADTVRGNVAAVRGARQRGIDELSAKWFKSDAEDSALAQLRGTFGVSIDRWATEGETAAKGASPPGAGGWPGWVTAGQILSDGVADMVGWSQGERLAEIIETVKAAPAVTAEAVHTAAKATAKAAKKAVGEIAGTAGEVASGVLAPLLVPLLLVVAVAVAVFVFVRAKA